MCIRDRAYIGLCAAVEHYDEDKGVPFINYAGFWIKQIMQRYIDNCGLSLIHILYNDIICLYKRSPSSSSFLKFHLAFLSRAALSASSSHNRSNFSFTLLSWVVSEETAAHSSKIFWSILSVSYTHLDVYKRQIQMQNGMENLRKFTEYLTIHWWSFLIIITSTKMGWRLWKKEIRIWHICMWTRKRKKYTRTAVHTKITIK